MSASHAGGGGDGHGQCDRRVGVQDADVGNDMGAAHRGLEEVVVRDDGEWGDFAGGAVGRGHAEKEGHAFSIPQQAEVVFNSAAVGVQYPGTLGGVH